MSNDIFTGNNFKLFYNNDTANRIPDNAGNEEINELAAMPSFGIESEIQTLETYDSEYSSKLAAEQNVDNIDITVNYIPDDETHAFLDAATESQKEFQLTLRYNIEDGLINYSMVNGQIQSANVSGDKDTVVMKTYSFVPTDVITRDGTALASAALVEGSYGVGSNGGDVPQYQPERPLGNSFIKIPASQVGNPSSADMMGVGLIDGTTFSSIAMTKTGSLAIYAKNQTTAWQRILTTNLGDTKYVALTGDQTIAGNKTFSGNVKVNSLISANKITGADVEATGAITGESIKATTSTLGVASAGSLTLGQALTVGNGGTGAKTAAEARTNLGVKAAGTFDIVPVANGGTGASTVAQAQVNLGIVTSTAMDGKYLIKASNLSDLTNVANARTNLGLGTSAVINTGTSGATIPLLSTDNTWSNNQNFNGNQNRFSANSSTGGGIEIGSTVAASTSYIDFHSSGSTVDYDARIQSTGGSTTAAGAGQMNINAASLHFNGVLTLTNKLAITEGGTGANSVEGARNNIQAMYRSQTALGTTNLDTLGAAQSGFYYQTANVNATTANKYPIAQAGGLYVYPTGAGTVQACVQEYTAYYNNRKFRRVLAGSEGWTGWKEYLTDDQLGTTIPTLDGGNQWNGSQVIKTGGLQVGTYNTSTVGFELGSQTTVAGSFIDFHSSGTGNDYDARIYCGGGASAVGQGLMTFSNGGSYFSSLITTPGINVTGTTAKFVSNAGNPMTITSANPCLSFIETDATPANSTYLFVADGGSFRLNRDSTGGVALFNYLRTTNTMSFAGVTTALGNTTVAGTLEIGTMAATGAINATNRITCGGTSAGTDAIMLRSNGSASYTCNLAANGVVRIRAGFSDTVGNYGFQTYTAAGSPQYWISLPLGGGALALQGTSGRDYKEDIVEAKTDEALERILSQKMVNFVYKDDEQKRQRFGIIAEESEINTPQYVKHNPEIYDEVLDEEGNIVEQLTRDRPSIDVNPIVMDLMGSVQSLKKDNDYQQSQIDELKALVQQLMNK
ncbi:pyocin knob domain-containing S74 family peptidase [Pseudocitrobacter faecalis]|uniref:Endosialidase-like protein n=1 Tax=Pseudocitrobacter faecalis TaxID=1398493 RepID=A0ABX9G3L2_9ENTR|nr:endosialidase-like protein [Pseudocitrobacter faecalis]